MNRVRRLAPPAASLRYFDRGIARCTLSTLSRVEARALLRSAPRRFASAARRRRAAASASAIWPRPGALRARDWRARPVVDRVSSRVAAVEVGAPGLRRGQQRGDQARSATAPRCDASSTSTLTRMFSTRGSVGGASGMNDRNGVRRQSRRRAAPPIDEQRHDFGHRLQRHAASRGAEREPHRQLAASRGARAPTAASTDSAPPPAAGTAPRRASRRARVRTFASRSACVGTTITPVSSSAGFAAAIRAAIALISLCASSTVTPGLSRATARLLLPRHLARQLAGIDGQRRPDLKLAARILKVRPHHADDRVRHAAEVDRLARRSTDRRRIAGARVASLSITTLLVADLVFLLGEAAADCRRHAQQRTAGSPRCAPPAGARARRRRSG